MYVYRKMKDPNGERMESSVCVCFVFFFFFALCCCLPCWLLCFASLCVIFAIHSYWLYTLSCLGPYSILLSNNGFWLFLDPSDNSKKKSNPSYNIHPLSYQHPLMSNHWLTSLFFTPLYPSTYRKNWPAALVLTDTHTNHAIKEILLLPSPPPPPPPPPPSNSSSPHHSNHNTNTTPPPHRPHARHG